jgi:hypothetical protein
MKKMRVLAFVALMALGVTSAVQALPIGTTGFDDIYYSDATFTTAVGERYMQCNGGVYRWGVVTQYKDGYDWDCATGQTINDCPSGFWICDGYAAPGTYYGCSCEG